MNAVEEAENLGGGSPESRVSVVVDEKLDHSPGCEPAVSGLASSAAVGTFLSFPPLSESGLLGQLVDEEEGMRLESAITGEQPPVAALDGQVEPVDEEIWAAAMGDGETALASTVDAISSVEGGEAFAEVLRELEGQQQQQEGQDGVACAVPQQKLAPQQPETVPEQPHALNEKSQQEEEEPQHEGPPAEERSDMEIDAEDGKEGEAEREEKAEEEEDGDDEEAPMPQQPEDRATMEQDGPRLPPQQQEEEGEEGKAEGPAQQPPPPQQQSEQRQAEDMVVEEEGGSAGATQQADDRKDEGERQLQAGEEEDEEEEQKEDEEEEEKEDEEEEEREKEADGEKEGADDEEKDEEEEGADEEEQAGPSGVGCREGGGSGFETVSIGSVLASVSRGLKRRLLPSQPSDDDDHDDDDSDVMWLGEESGDADVKPRAQKEQPARHVIEAMRKSRQPGLTSKEAVVRARAGGLKGRKTTRKGGAAAAAASGGGGGGGSSSTAPPEKRPVRALPVRNCTRPEEILRRATYAEMPSRGTMLSDPMSMPSITTMIARLPANRVWQVEKSACQNRPNLEEQLETYKTKGSYSCMTHDTVRNVRFETSLKWATKACNRKRWLEVGTGADAVLTLMVLQGDSKVNVLGIEVNEDAVTRARLVLKAAGLSERAILVNGLSTDDNTIETANDFGPFDAIVHELIGLFAGCEGAAYLLQRLKTDYRLSGSVIQVPCAAATFFAPALILPDDFNAQHFDVYVVKNYFSLVKRLGITAAQGLTGGRGGEWMKSGVMEFLDFTSDDRLDVPQTRSINFISPQHDAYVNALVCWIWVETSREGAAPRSNQTAYPYGASEEDAPPRPESSVAFSSRSDDTTACASNWRNMIIPLRQTHRVPQGVPLQVDSCANLRSATPSYHFVVSCQNTTLCERHIFNMVPTYTALRDLVAMSKASAAAATAAAKKSW